MVVAPLVMLLYDRVFLASSWNEVLRQRGWLYAACCLPLVVAFVVFAPRILGGDSAGFSLATVTPWQYLRSQPAVILHYLQLAAWPAGQCLDYAWPVANGTASIVLSGLAVLALVGASLYALWRWPAVGFLGVAFFLVLAPTSSIMPINDLAVEHRMYLPLAAVVALVVLACWELILARRLASPASVAACLVLVAAAILGGLTVARNRLYHDPVAMWTDVVHKAPHNGRAQSNLGKLLADADRLDEALPYLRHAVALQPGLAHTHANLARALLAEGRELSLAQQHAEAAVALEPGSGRFRQQLGLVAVKRRDYQEAARQFREAIQLSPADPLLHFNFGQCLAELKDDEAAVEAYQTAIGLDPASSEARRNLIRLLLARNRRDEALRQSLDFVKQAGHDSTAHYLLALTYQELNRPAEALDAFNAALRIDPNHAQAHYDKGLLHQQQKEYAAALQSYREAVRAQPDFADAHNNLAGLLLMKNHSAEAARHYEAALRADPTYYQARFNLALILGSQGKLDAAAVHYRQILNDRPSFQPAKEQLDKILLQQKRQAKAAKPTS
jgi:tetratricopeptide (TPR) repeat protein